MRLLTVGVFLLLTHTTYAADTHVWGVEPGSVNVIYKTHTELPEWAMEGEGPLWHWKAKNGRWYQTRGTKARYLAARYPKPRVRPQVCHT